MGEGSTLMCYVYTTLVQLSYIYTIEVQLSYIYTIVVQLSYIYTIVVQLSYTRTTLVQLSCIYTIEVQLCTIELYLHDSAFSMADYCLCLKLKSKLNSINSRLAFEFKPSKTHSISTTSPRRSACFTKPCWLLNTLRSRP